MTKHERNLLPAGTSPAIDGAAPDAETPATAESQVQPEDFPDGISPRWDVAQIATRGHVLVGRFEYLSQKLRYPTIWLWLLLLVLTWAMFNGKIDAFGPRLMSFDGRGIFQRMLTFEPDGYFDIGGGLKGGPDLAWLGDYAPTPESLSASDHEALISAVVADSTKNGTNAEAWEQVAHLKVQPMLTRPAKAFAENSDELRNGVVAIPEDGGRDIIVSAYVEGRWSFTIIRGDRCAALAGPVAKDCGDQTREDGWSGMAVEAIKTLKPKE